MVKLFTHTDLDGVGCAILTKLAFTNVEIEYCGYDTIDKKVRDYIKKKDSDYVFVLITDISVNNETAKLLDIRKNVQLIDHHRTALDLNKYSWCNVSVLNENGIKTSGTELLYNYLKANNRLQQIDADRFVEVITNYDNWEWTKMGAKGLISKQVNDLYNIYSRDKFITWCVSQLHDEVFPRFYAADTFLLQAKQTEIEKYVKRKNKQLIKTDFNCKKCGIVFADKYISELGNDLCELNSDIDFVCIINLGEKKVSYRTCREDIDVSEIAKLFDGGGHKQASGSTFTEELQLKVVEIIFPNVE